MVVETGIVVTGTGYAGSAIVRALAGTHPGSAAYLMLDKAHGEMLLDLILDEAGEEVAGALIVQDGEVRPVRCPVVILATGSVSGLFPGGDWKASGDGLAIAHRAGLSLTRPHVLDGPAGKELRAGVPCDADGATKLHGLFVAGSLGSDRPLPEKVAKAAVLRSRQAWAPFGPYRHHPTIDSPLPAGFAQVKFDRLRAVLDKALKGEIERDRALMELHRLKGEADEFARARVDLELFSLQNACEVALLLLKNG